MIDYQKIYETVKPRSNTVEKLKAKAQELLDRGLSDEEAVADLKERFPRYSKWDLSRIVGDIDGFQADDDWFDWGYDDDTFDTDMLMEP